MTEIEKMSAKEIANLLTEVSRGSRANINPKQEAAEQYQYALLVIKLMERAAQLLEDGCLELRS